MTIEFYYGRKHQAVMEAAKAVDAVKGSSGLLHRALWIPLPSEPGRP